ncbi:type II toxin-antitoxin system VapC family toxin [candidate division KSB1 bacterium]|nr:type II toxin-antitoxin system VapC family toxin [candidate division KSB1 bacterium]
MKILLDTHILLWYISGDARLPEDKRDAICSAENEIYLSVVSLWETLIKHHIGKLTFPQPPELCLPEQRERHRIASLASDEISVARLATLPPLHRDPFDRMLICQAHVHGLVLMTVDEILRANSVQIFA